MLIYLFSFTFPHFHTQQTLILSIVKTVHLNVQWIMNLQKRVVVLILVSLIFLDLEKHCDAMDVCDCISFVWCVEQF